MYSRIKDTDKAIPNKERIIGTLSFLHPFVRKLIQYIQAFSVSLSQRSDGKGTDEKALGEFFLQISVISEFLISKTKIQKSKEITDMSYNYAAEKKKFDCEWEKTKAWYRECGMSEESISEMYEFDCMEFRRQRTRLTREQPMFYLTEGGQDVNILESFPENISKISVNDKYRFYDGEYGWIDEIDNRKAQEVIFRMKELDKKILALLIDGYSQISIAKILCVKPLKIYRHVEKLRGILSEIYAVS